MAMMSLMWLSSRSLSHRGASELRLVRGSDPLLNMPITISSEPTSERAHLPYPEPRSPGA